MSTVSREVPIDPAHAALLIIDVQDYCAAAGKSEYFNRSLREMVLPNIRRLQSVCGGAGIEVIYSAIENLTRDGRDRSLDYKISGIDASNVFISTNIDDVLRNLHIRSLIVAGIMTDQCVESAVRDACDLGYLVTLASDVCTTSSAERHEQSLIGIRGYCRQRSGEAVISEIAAATDPG